MRPLAAIRPLRAWTTTTISMPARAALGPVLPKAVTEAITSLGNRTSTDAGSRPSCLSKPGRKFMRMTSAQASKASKTGRAAGSLNRRGSECLPRLRERKMRVSPGPKGLKARVGSPSGASILMTVAPPSARSWAQNGTATNWPNSTTRIPVNGCESLISSPSLICRTRLCFALYPTRCGSACPASEEPPSGCAAPLCFFLDTSYLR